MLNQTVLVGRIVETPTENGEIKIAIPKSFKNADGEYETDFIAVRLFTPIVSNVKEYCKKGDIIGVKGRLQTNDNKLEVIAEKVTFLSSSKE